MTNIFEKNKKWLLREKYGAEKESELKSGKISDFSTDLERLKKGEPLAFIIGFVDFLNCRIDLKFKPLIPRPETEFWVNDFIKTELRDYTTTQLNSCIVDSKNELKIKTKNKIKILDIFSGSGCIGISILKNSETRSSCFLDFTEINPNFIKQIKKNISLNLTGSPTTWEIYQSDLFENIPKNKKYDYILANPPYIPKNKKIIPSVLNFEDYNSLFAEDNGLYFIKKTISEGLDRLKEGGKIFTEFDENSKKEIEDFLKNEKIKKYQFKKDQFKNDRLLIIKK